MRQALSRLLQVRRDEGGLILLALAFAFGSVGQTAVIRIFADATLLTVFDASYLPPFLIGSAAAFMGASVFYATALSRLGSVRLNTWLLAAFAVLSLAARPLLPLLGPAFVFVLCLLLTVAAPLVRIVCWNAITECFDTRQAKRLLPIAGAGSTIGAIVAGVLTAPFIRAVGTDDLLYVVAFLFAAMAPIPRLLSSRAIGVAAPAARAQRPRGSAQPASFWEATALGMGTIRRNQLVATVAAMLFLWSMIQCLLDYGLKTAIQQEFAKDEMAIFLGHYQALVNALILVLQLFVVGRVLVTFGIRLVFALLPLSLLLGATYMTLDPVFFAIVGLSFVELLLRYTFQNAAGEMVLTPVPTLERNRAKVVIKGVLVPLGLLLAALMLVPLREIWPDTEETWRALAWIVVAIVALWLVQVIRVKRFYIDQLQVALGFGRVVLGSRPEAQAALEGGAVRALVKNLENERPEGLDFSLDLLASALNHIPQARFVLGHPNPRVRAAALKAIATYHLERHRRRVRELLGREQEPEVVCAALAALRSIDPDRGVDLAKGFAEHPDPQVQAEALAFLFGEGTAEERHAARRAAERWMAGTPEERRTAAYLIGEMAAPAPGSELAEAMASRESEGAAPWDLAALGELLSDHEVSVRKAAYLAVGRARVQVYIPRLVQALSDREEAWPASVALKRFGGAAVPVMVRAYRGWECSRSLRLRIVQALGSLAVTDAVFALLDLLKEGDAEVRRLALRSLVHLRRAVTPRAFIKSRLIEALLREIRLGHLCFGLIAEAHDSEAGEFFVDEVRFRLRGTAERIFEILGLLYDPRVMRALHRRYRLGPAPVRANMLELLENTVEPDLRKPLARLLEDVPLPERARRARQAWALSEKGSFAATLLDATEDRWLQRCYLCVSGPEFLRRYPSRAREVESMMPILERVILLKSVPLFSELSGESLYPIAEIAEELRVGQGTVLFEEGDVGTYLYVVVRGEVEILKNGAPLARRKARDAFGEMALLDERPRSATAVAREDTELLRIGGEPFSDLLDQNPEISRGLIRVLLSYVRGESGPQVV